MTARHVAEASPRTAVLDATFAAARVFWEIIPRSVASGDAYFRSFIAPRLEQRESSTLEDALQRGLNPTLIAQVIEDALQTAPLVPVRATADQWVAAIGLSLSTIAGCVTNLHYATAAHQRTLTADTLAAWIPTLIRVRDIKHDRPPDISYDRSIDAGSLDEWFALSLPDDVTAAAARNSMTPAEAQQHANEAGSVEQFRAALTALNALRA